MNWLKLVWIIFTGVLLAFPVGFWLYFLFRWLKKVFFAMKKKIENIRALEKMKNDLLQKSANEYTESVEEWKGEIDSSNKPQDNTGEKDSSDKHQNNEEEMKNKEEIKNDEEKEWEQILEKTVLEEKDRQMLNALIYQLDLLKNDGKIEEYEKKIIEGLSLDPENISLNKRLADLYFSREEHKKSLSLLKRIIEKDPEDHTSLWQIGEIYLNNQDFETAEILIEKAIDLNTENPKYYMSMVKVYYSTKRHIEAVQIMEKVIKLRPDNPKYLQLIAEFYDELGDEDNAVKYYFRLLENDPSNPQAKKRLNK